MSDVPKHPRLVLRNGIFYHRAAIPADLRDTYPKTEETFSLKTRDPKEALRRVRKAAAEVDDRFAAHRQAMADGGALLRDAISDAELAAVEQAYFVHLLEEDDARRFAGFYDGQQLDLPAPTFEEHEEAVQSGLASAKHSYARAKSDVFYDQEVDEVLTWTPFNIRLSPGSPDRIGLVRAIQRAEIRAFQAIDSRNQGEIIDTPKAQSVNHTLSAPKVSAVVTDWIAEKENGWEAKTTKAHGVAMRWFTELTGDRPIDTYTKADGRAFKSALQVLPANWTKHPKLAGLDFKAAAEAAAKLDLDPMSTKNATKNIRFVSAFWRWTIDNYDEVTADPMVLPSQTTGSAVDERDPFTEIDLAAIFSAPLYSGCASLRKWKEPGSLIPTSSGRYWIPLVAAYTGARLAEIVQLYVADIKEQSGILYFDLITGETEDDDRRLKTDSARRSIPIHSELLAIGFDKFLQSAKNSKQQRLFPDIKKGADGTYSSVFSKWYSNYLVAAGVKTPKKSFHSFRHTFADACSAAEIPLEYKSVLLGHTMGGETKRYGKGAKGHPVAVLHKYIEGVSYPSISSSKLVR